MEMYMKAPIRSFVPLVIITVGLALAPAATTLRAQSVNAGSNWWAVGSTGIADESTASLVSFEGAAASLRPSSPAGTVATVRYPVSLAPGLLYVDAATSYIYSSLFTRLRLTMTFVKNDDGAYVAAALKRIRLSDGVETSMAGTNSMAAFPAATVQAVDRTITCAAGCIDPSRYAYYVEVTLWAPAATSDPQLSALRVHLFVG
jgi:hypothetical protein